MEINKAAKLANLVVTFRPWNVREVTAEIETLDGDELAIINHVMRIAADPETRFPSRISLTWNPDTPPPGDTRRPGNPASCDQCYRSEWACQKAQRNTGLDSHPYRPAQPRGYRMIEDNDILEVLAPLLPTRVADA